MASKKAHVDTHGKAIYFQDHLLPLLQPSCPHPSTFCSSQGLGVQNQDCRLAQRSRDVSARQEEARNENPLAPSLTRVTVWRDAAHSAAEVPGKGGSGRKPGQLLQPQLSLVQGSGSPTEMLRPLRVLSSVQRCSWAWVRAQQSSGVNMPWYMVARKQMFTGLINKTLTVRN